MTLDLSTPNLPKLPAAYEWGEQRGDYRSILRDGKPVAMFGGVACKVCDEWQRELDYQIARYEYRKTVGLA